MDQGDQGWKQLSPGWVVAGIQAEIFGALGSDGGYRERQWKDLRHIFK